MPLTSTVQSQLINYKILNRCYWTPSRMARLKLINDAKCWRCNQTTGTMIHMLYECDKVVVFWDKLIAFLNKLLNLAWHKNPGLCMLGIFQKDGLSYEQTLWCRLNKLQTNKYIKK
uniref:Reverse transcriptase zinc-binding domain-containing protein n=1 Tax=Neogobius melanostomus TaxID=47308 RepID=A0A8C6SC24_9GOBI